MKTNPNDPRYPLFKHLYDEHGLIATESEIDEIIRIATDSGWKSVEDELPEFLETVWLANDRQRVWLGCRVEYEEGWFWAESTGFTYVDDGAIVAECDGADLDVTLWHKLPKMKGK